MSGPHPAVARIRLMALAALGDADALGRGVLVACSGGADSTALAAAVAFHAPRRGVPAGLVTVDHGMQPGSGDVARRVAALAEELGFDPVHVVRVEVGAGGGPEDAARRARYAVFDELAGAHDADVLLAHTLDDQAETVLLGLGRGSGSRSVAGMRARNGRYVRPLLGLRRADTVSACAALGLDVWDDPHNVDPAYRRVRVRTEVLPLLEDVLGGGVASALARTAELAQADADALDAWASTAFVSAIVGPAGVGPAGVSPAGVSPGAVGPAPEGPAPVINRELWPGERPQLPVDHAEPGAESGAEPGIGSGAEPGVGSGAEPGTGLGDHAGSAAARLDVASLADLPLAVRSRVLRTWATGLGAGPLTAERTAAVDALITGWRGQGPIELPGGVAVRRVHDRLEVVTPPPATVPETAV